MGIYDVTLTDNEIELYEELDQKVESNGGSLNGLEDDERIAIDNLNSRISKIGDLYNHLSSLKGPSNAEVVYLNRYKTILERTNRIHAKFLSPEKINMVCSYLSEKESVLPASGLLWLNALRERQQEITKSNSEKGLS